MIRRFWRLLQDSWSQRRIARLIVDLHAISEERRQLLQASIWPYTEEVAAEPAELPVEEPRDVPVSEPCSSDESFVDAEAFAALSEEKGTRANYNLLTERLVAYSEVIRCLNGTASENSNVPTTTSVVAILDYSNEIRDAITDIYQAVAHDIHRISQQTLTLKSECQEV